MCGSLLFSLPALSSRACARSDSKSASPPWAALRFFPIAPRCARGESGKPHRPALPARCGTPRCPRRRSPAAVPHTCTRNSFPPERGSAVSLRDGSSCSASRFLWESALSGRCALGPPGAPHSDRSLRPSARRLRLCLGLYGADRFSKPPTPQVFAPRRPSICRRIAILPRPSRAPPPAGRRLSPILSAPEKTVSASATHTPPWPSCRLTNAIWKLRLTSAICKLHAKLL